LPALDADNCQPELAEAIEELWAIRPVYDVATRKAPMRRRRHRPAANWREIPLQLKARSQTEGRGADTSC